MDTEKISKSCNYDISVIVPVYNIEEEYLRPCLDSILNQTKDKLEIIIIDDGSTDDSPEICDEYAELYNNITVHHIENNGLGHARNYGASLAHGKYIYFIDSDDEIATNILEKMYCAAERNGSDMTICNVERYNSSSEWASNLHQRAFRNLETVTHIRKNHDLLYDTTSWNKLIRRDYWEKHGFAFPENILYEDIPTTIPLHYLANNVSVIKSYGYKWRVRDGASKSITQNTTDLVNLNDRITILKMLDKFFDENVKEKSLRTEQEIKLLRFDMMIFVNNCIKLDRENVEEIMRVIADYISTAVSKETFDKLGFVEKHLYDCLLANDYEGFVKTVEYRKNDYPTAPFYERDGRLYAKLPQDIFGTDEADVTNEPATYNPRIYIKDISGANNKINISAHLYFWKVNLSSFDEQEVKAYLLNEYTGEETPLELKPRLNSELTMTKGVVFNKTYGEKSEYNYDGTGFDITIDLDTLSNLDSFKNCFIILRYKNRYSKGIALLRSMNGYNAKKANGLSIINDSGICRLSVHAGCLLNLEYSHLDCTLEKLSVKGGKLFFELNKSSKLVAVPFRDELDSLEFTEYEPNKYSLSVKDIEYDRNYSVYSLNEDGTQFPLVRQNKSITLKDKGKYILIIRSNKSYNINICKVKAASFIEEYSAQDSVISIKTVSAGSFSAEKYDRAKLVFYDSYTDSNYTLATATPEHLESKAYCSFDIDFADEKTQKNLYQDYKTLYIEYFKPNGKSVCQMLYSKKHFKTELSFDTLGVTLYRANEGMAKLHFTAPWSEEEATLAKRKALMHQNYPKYLKEPINKRMILFESMWGTKYSCNPQALYEYIDKNYPQYECVWSMKDTRIPINGRARVVRRGSQEYYRVLATTKYLVNNVNFEDDYIKRKGQIEIQTMHGTPLKSLGLDVESDFKSIAHRENFIKKCHRWDYLIVQGEFMSSMAYQIYRFSKKMLKTGYPRTDVLYKKPNIKKLKKSLGIPLDKKVILYTPTWRKRNTFEMMLDLEKAREMLSDKYVLLVRLHHLCGNGYEVPADNKFIFNLTKYTDIQELYHISDILITDYSSVMFDYALLDKPMIFFTYDLETYSEATRGVYFDIREEAPGPIVYTSDELINAVINIQHEIEKVSDRAAAFKQKYLTFENPNSSQLVVDKVLKPSKIATHFAKKRMSK